MADDLTKRGSQDRQRINVHEDYELPHWSEKVRHVEGRATPGRRTGRPHGRWKV